MNWKNLDESRGNASEEIREKEEKIRELQQTIEESKELFEEIEAGDSRSDFKERRTESEE